MNKYVKGCLVFIGICLGILAILTSLFLWSLHSNRKDSEVDSVKFSKECDSVKYITEQPEIKLSGFKENEINILTFQLLRNGKFINEIVIKDDLKKGTDVYSSPSITIPYQKFLKTDTIVVTTKNKLQYYISGYHHYPYLHYGMFGYVCSHDCRFSDDNVIINNNASGNATLSRIEGWVNPEIGKQIRKINAIDNEYQKFSKQSPIKIKDAEKIFMDNRKNKTLLSLYSYGIEITPENSYYIFGEEIESKKNQIDIVKINTKNGACKRYTNYPFEN